MRTHRTVYRVLNADGTEAYRGKRSAVLRFLGAKKRAGLCGAVIEYGSYDPTVERGPFTWGRLSSREAVIFRTRSTP